MEIGSEVIWRGRVYVLNGIDPMNVSGRRAYLLGGEEGGVLIVPIEEVEPRPEPSAFDPAA